MSELTPTQVVGATFKTVRKGYDPDEVDAFLERTAKALEEAQQQATAMEARARAAVARLQEMSSAAEQQQAATGEEQVRVAPDEAETISRTLLLAQRTADAAVADARAEAERIRSEAQREAETTIDSTREMSAKLLEDARSEARRAQETERVAAENEVQSLIARREFLVSDVDQLEQFLIDQRERLRAAARQIEALCERVPAGLGQVRPPVLSAADDPPGDDTSEQFRPHAAVVDLGDEEAPPTRGAPLDDLDPTQELRFSDLAEPDADEPSGPIAEATAVRPDDPTPPAGVAGSDDGDDGWRADDRWGS